MLLNIDLNTYMLLYMHTYMLLCMHTYMLLHVYMFMDAHPYTHMDAYLHLIPHMLLNQHLSAQCRALQESLQQLVEGLGQPESESEFEFEYEHQVPALISQGSGQEHPERDSAPPVVGSGSLLSPSFCV